MWRKQRFCPTVSHWQFMGHASQMGRKYGGFPRAPLFTAPALTFSYLSQPRNLLRENISTWLTTMVANERARNATCLFTRSLVSHRCLAHVGLSKSNQILILEEQRIGKEDIIWSGSPLKSRCRMEQEEQGGWRPVENIFGRPRSP